MKNKKKKISRNKLIIDEYGYGGAISGGISGISSGVSLGSVAGPIGAGVGAVVGGLFGAISGNKAEKRAEAERKAQEEAFAEQKRVASSVAQYNSMQSFAQNDAADFYANNPYAISLAMGGMARQANDLAYVSKHEVRGPNQDGEFVVEKRGGKDKRGVKDNVLVNTNTSANNKYYVFSNKLKHPETKRSFSKVAEERLIKPFRLQKNNIYTDSVAETTRELNNNTKFNEADRLMYIQENMKRKGKKIKRTNKDLYAPAAFLGMFENNDAENLFLGIAGNKKAITQANTMNKIGGIGQALGALGPGIANLIQGNKAAPIAPSFDPLQYGGAAALSTNNAAISNLAKRNLDTNPMKAQAKSAYSTGMYNSGMSNMSPAQRAAYSLQLQNQYANQLVGINQSAQEYNNNIKGQVAQAQMQQASMMQNAAQQSAAAAQSQYSTQQQYNDRQSAYRMQGMSDLFKGTQDIFGNMQKMKQNKMNASIALQKLNLYTPTEANGGIIFKKSLSRRIKKKNNG